MRPGSLKVSFVALACLPGLALALGAPHRTPPPPTTTPPAVSLTLTAAAPAGGWQLKLTNTGSDPVRIVADARLYSFEITTPPGTTPPPRHGTPAGPTRCALPADMVPTTDTDRTLVLVAGRSWTVNFDPHLYCFSVAQSAALVNGSTVTATFGFLPARATPPYAIAPTAALDGGAGPARSVAAAPVTLADPVTDGGAASTEASVAVPSDAYPVHLKVSVPERLDVSRVFEESVTITIANEGDRPVRGLFSPQTVGFLVETPRGSLLRCGADLAVAIQPELVTTLAPHGRTAISLDIGTTCRDVFRRPGLYRVRPRFDSRHVSAPANSNYYSGEAVGAPMLLRVRVGEETMPPPRVDPP